MFQFFFRFPAFAGLLLLCVALKAQPKPTPVFSFVAMGDMPYTLPEDYTRFENLIKTVNEQNQVFNIHVGDIKASTTPCSEASYGKILNYFQQFSKPLIYIPGDNEWTDCNKKEAGAYDPEERLEVIRKTFFKDKNSSFGKEKMTVASQADDAKFSKFVENRRWEYGKIGFATFHIVGTNNNFVPVSKNGNQEFYGREKANLAWLDEVFAQAKSGNQLGLVLFLHADMFNPDKDSKEANGFTSFLKRLKEQVVDFKKPVLLINGDSHVFLVEKPLYENAKTKKALDNFTRLQVPGENNMHAVKITVNPGSPGLFQIEELHVPGN